MGNHSLKGLVGILGVLALLILGPAASARAEQDTFRVGKEGIVTLSSTTAVGGFRLNPGSYKISCEHLESGDHHLVFTRMAKRLPSSSRSRRPTSDITKVACAMEILPLTMSQTKMVLTVSASGERSIRKVLIQGENVSHEFPALTELPLSSQGREPKGASAEVHPRLGAGNKVLTWK